MKIAKIPFLLLLGSFLIPSTGTEAAVLINSDSVEIFSAELIIQPNLQRDYNLESGVDRERTHLFFRRIRPRFFYHPNERWSFFLQLGLSPGDRDMGLESYSGKLFAPRLLFDAVATFKLNSDLELAFGQTKLPFTRQRFTPFANVFMFDRSLVNSFYTIDFDVGIFAQYNFQRFNFPLILHGAVSSGRGRNVRFSSLGPALTIRAEVFPLGQFSPDDFQSETDWSQSEDIRMRVGAGFHSNFNAIREGGQTGDFLFEDGIARNIRAFAADLMVKYMGWTFIWDFGSRSTNNPLSLNELPQETEVKYIREGYGMMWQLNYAFDQHWAAGIEYAFSRPDSRFRDGSLHHQIFDPRIGKLTVLGKFRMLHPDITFQGGFSLVCEKNEELHTDHQILEGLIQASIRIK